MTFDCSRFSFHPWKDFFGVVMQQGRVQLDSDWNEWVAELMRRLQAGTMDTLGQAVVPRTTPDGFNILAANGELTIGRGRIYVDGLLAENHGAEPLEWDPRLAELRGTAPLPFFEQPYLPFNATNQPAPADVFNRPTLNGGPHLVYVDVWQREFSHLQDADLIEKAVGVDTSERLQTVWQVRLLPNIGNATCATPDEEVPGWAAVIRPSGARLTNATGDVPGDPNPCLVPPAAGYKGSENQLYRVEIHRGGPQNTATFKWSRDNGTVATRVTEIQGGNRLVVESLGRDEILGFHGGDWIEILDDWHELHQRPGQLRRIRLGDGIDTATRSILLDDTLPAGLFPVDGQGRTDAARNTRIRRWDQSNIVRRADGSEFHDLNQSASSDGIPLPPAGTQLTLENGILVEFTLVAPGQFEAGDNWVFAARAADASIEPLDQALPRGIHHHYARLALVTFPDSEADCRTLWPPVATGESCDCTVCVHAEAHNNGTATIQQAIDQVRNRGGTICLDAGTYNLRAPLNFEGAGSVRLRGQGWMTILQAGVPEPAINIVQCTGITIENLSILASAAGSRTTPAIAASNCVDLTLENLAIVSVAGSDATSAAVGLSGLVLAGKIRDCTFVAEQGVVAIMSEDDYLFTTDLSVTGNVFLCSQRGVSFADASLHFGELLVSGNLFLTCGHAAVTVTGAALPAASVTVSDNIMNVSGTGIAAGTAGLRLRDNEIVGMVGRIGGDGISLEGGLDPAPLDHLHITGNRLRDLRGAGMAIRRTVDQAIIKSNTVDGVRGSGLIIENEGTAAYLSIENNHFDNLGQDVNDALEPYFGMQLVASARLDVIANVISGVARQATQNPMRAGLLAAASGEFRASGNRLFGLGPQQFIGRTVGIAIASGVNQPTIDANAIARIDTPSEVAAPAAWQAIVVAQSFAARDRGGAITVPGFAFLPLETQMVYLNAFRVDVAALTPASVTVRTNQMRGQQVIAPLVEIDQTIGCLFDQNDGEMSGDAAGRGAVALVEIVGQHIGAASNRLIGGRDQISLRLDTKSFAVLGNITSGPIQVSGAPLPPPWDALNIHV